MADLIKRWKDLFAEPQLPAVKPMLEEGVQLHSPMMHTPQTGIDLVANYIIAAHKIYRRWDFDYIRGFQNGNEVCLEFEGTVDGVLINGVDLIRWSDNDKIEDFKIIVRPVKGLQKLGEIMTGILGELQQAR